MLKRAALDQVVIGVFAIESITWHRRFLKSVKKLQHKDFELKTLAAVPIEEKLAAAIQKKLTDSMSMPFHSELLACIVRSKSARCLLRRRLIMRLKHYTDNCYL